MRLEQIDFTKGVLITLMILFHIVDFADLYTPMYRWVYAFHMPAFLVISGYLFNYNKSARQFLISLRGIVLPYALFYALYIVGQLLLGSMLGTRTAFDISNVGEFLSTLALRPEGTYWYLHTLAICQICVYGASVLVRQYERDATQSSVKIIAISATILFLISRMDCGVEWQNIAYFMIGVAMHSYGIKISERGFSTLWAIVPVVAITLLCAPHRSEKLSGIALTLSMLSLLTALYSLAPKAIQRTFTFLGRNTLSVVLFSPMILIFIRYFIRPFGFDSTNITYAILSTIIGISFSIFASIVSDKLQISKLIVGKRLFCE